MVGARMVGTETCEGNFSKRGHGIGKGRGCPTALAVVDMAVKHGYRCVADAS